MNIQKTKCRFLKTENRSFAVCAITCLFTCLFVCSASANDSEERQRRIERFQETINLAETLLEQTHQNTRKGETELNLLSARISSRKALLSELADEFDHLDSNIDTLNVEIGRQKERLVVLKANYAKMLQYIHVQRNRKNKWLFILSAENFAQSYRHYRYMQELTASANYEMEQIKKLTEQLEAKIQEIADTKNNKIRITQQQEEEIRRLSIEQNNQTQVVQNLKQRERQLLEAMRRRERLMEGLSNRVRANTETERHGTLTAQDERLLTQNFERNKGQLPLPVERGVISGRFGRQQHPVLQHVTTDNKGINIQTTAGADALAIFDGVVVQRFVFPGYNNAIIVRHGSYRTVYSNLTDVFVREGDIVSARQPLGKIFTDRADSNKTELFFLLYKERELLNPELFIKK